MKTKQLFIILLLTLSYNTVFAQLDYEAVRDELKFKDKIYLFNRSALNKIDGFKSFIEKDETLVPDFIGESILLPAPTIYKGYYVKLEIRRDSAFVVDVVQDTCKYDQLTGVQRIIPKSELFKRFEDFTGCKFNENNEMFACWLSGDFYLLRTLLNDFMESCDKKSLTYDAVPNRLYDNEFRFTFKKGILDKKKKMRPKKQFIVTKKGTMKMINRKNKSN